jgi:hypothetical protein
MFLARADITDIAKKMLVPKLKNKIQSYAGKDQMCNDDYAINISDAT